MTPHGYRTRVVFLFSFLTLLSWFHSVIAQDITETGLPYIQNYSPDIYGGAAQNWDVIQSKEGFIYIGNNQGVLEYDGVTWRTILLPNSGICGALGITTENKIYVGGYNELGFLAPDAAGQLKYTSLLPTLGKVNFGGIKDISIANGAVYFNSDEGLLIWKDGQFLGSPKAPRYNISKNIRGEIYVVEKNLLVKKLTNSGHVDIIDVSKTNAIAITDLIGFGENELLILTYDKGLFITKNGTLEPFGQKVSRNLETSLGRRIIAHDNGWYSIATFKSGIIIMDTSGKIIKVVTKALGMIDNTVFRLFEDRQRGVWAATNGGISRIELLSPYSIFDDRHGIEGYVNDIYVEKGQVYLANYKGVLRLESDTNTPHHSYFKSISPLKSSTQVSSRQAIQFLALNGSLFAGTRAGLYRYEDGKVVQQFGLSSGALMQSKQNPNRIYVGLIDGLASIVFRNGQWEDDGRINGIKDDIRAIKEDTDGDIWLESQVDGVWKVAAEHLRDASDFHDPVVKHFRANKELPNGILFLKSIGNQVLFNIDSHLYTYDSAKDSIIRDSGIAKLFDLPGKISLKMEDQNGTVWMYAQLQKEEKKSRVRAVKQQNGSYLLNRIPDERIVQDVDVAHFPENNVVWYGGSGSVIRHDLSIPGNENMDFDTHIRSVTIQNDSVLFWGVDDGMNEKEIPFKGNEFRFAFAAPSFDVESKNQFQYFLEGFDESWSPWTSETNKDYTNIPEGDYQFKVRSKNIFNHIGTEDSFAFHIIPPWYRSWWAYLCYVLATVGIMILITQWRSRQLSKQNLVLEGVIKERTKEISHKNELLSHQTEQLMALGSAKTRLYANITHEFRTPLTVILGMADTLRSQVKSKETTGMEKGLDMIQRNGKSLLQLVNEMLELAKLESGVMELNLVQTDIVPLVKYLSESFHSLAETKQIRLTVYSEIDALEMDVDVNKVASIISNILSNAIKFTAANGKIIVHLNKVANADKEFFIIKVKDDGMGLSEEAMAHLFDRFYQADSSASRLQEGSGIGLSLVKEFVEMMKGTITVTSDLGKGSTFTVQLPVTNEAIKKTDPLPSAEPSLPKPLEAIVVDSEPSEQNTELPLVLLIEDNEDVAHYLRASLHGKYQTLHSANGTIGIDMAFEKIPDIIICDVMMPGKDGFEVCATLKTDARTDHIPIILLTAKASKEDRLLGLSHGADAYLAKPFNKEELFTRLDQLVLLRKKILRKISQQGVQKFASAETENPESKFLQKAILIIHSEMANANFGSSELADKLHLSESQTYRKLKAVTDKSTAVFIRSIRLLKAKELIETTYKSISEIAYEVGFNDPSWFSRAFKEEFGCSPSDIHK